MGIVGFRTAVLPASKLIATYNMESKIGIHAFAPSRRMLALQPIIEKLLL